MEAYHNLPQKPVRDGKLFCHEICQHISVIRVKAGQWIIYWIVLILFFQLSITVWHHLADHTGFVLQSAQSWAGLRGDGWDGTNVRCRIPAASLVGCPGSGNEIQLIRNDAVRSQCAGKSKFAQVSVSQTHKIVKTRVSISRFHCMLIEKR